jgi:tol-pal system protein YbgF
MLTLKRSFFLIALLTSVSFGSPAFAQESARIDALEDQIRQLVGQIEELTYEVKQLKTKVDGGQQTGAVVPKILPPKKLAAVEQGVEEVQDAPQEPAMAKTVIDDNGDEQVVAVTKAPGPKILGTIGDNAATTEDGFQGQVIVPLGAGEQISGQALTENAAPAEGNADAIEQVSLNSETPENLYEKSNESLLRRQFGEAEAGFRGFVEKYPDHSLAGSAQYWLGETYYAQGDFRQAAQNFLTGYKTYPKSRRAPDSLLKLGISLNKMGEKEQGCAALSTIADAYPKAVDAKKRAQVELKRASC